VDANKKTCLVIQGFGKRNDFQQGKIFDLDASYEVIKEAVEDVGLMCYRSDELGAQGIIDQKMYDALLDTDVVIADLSTLNANALYELGVRFALRPYATIVVAEQGINFPFDVNHIYIHTYYHLGEDVGRRDAREFQKRLKPLVQKAAADPELDSPVYRFLPTLRPPFDTADDTHNRTPFSEIESPLAPEQSQPISLLLEQARLALDSADFEAAKTALQAALNMRPNDNYLVQQLALVTYKSQTPDPKTALFEAKTILQRLNPKTSHDPETLGLWGAVHKRFWDLTNGRADLGEAIFAYERGFKLRNDYYSGINLAFLLNVRATLSEPADAIADFVLANRIRQRVIEICERRLQDLLHTENEDALKTSAEAAQQRDQKFWLLATLQEAAVGLGDDEAAAHWRRQAREVTAAEWMIDVTQMQIDKLKALMTPSPLRYLSAL
jgi:hypothetical protein